MDVYKSLNSHTVLSFTERNPEVKEVNVCVGEEWHRFPSSFFLPNKRSAALILFIVYYSGTSDKGLEPTLRIEVEYLFSAGVVRE